jgi:hypothetical protein
VLFLELWDSSMAPKCALVDEVAASLGETDVARNALSAKVVGLYRSGPNHLDPRSPERRSNGAAMTQRSTSGEGDIAQRDAHQLRRGTLGVLGIAFFVVSAAAPLTAMAGGAPVAMLLGNGPGIPLAYVVVSVILLIFAVGYTAMARHHTSTGAFYTATSPAASNSRPAALQRLSPCSATTRCRSACTGCSARRHPPSSPRTSAWTSRGGCSSWSRSR